MSWTPETHRAVGPETTVSFVVTFTNPGTLLETESLEIPITALGDGVVLGSTVATITMVAGVRPPVASFTVDLDVAPVGQSLTFDASDSYDSDGSIASYSWDYGDGETGVGASSVHVYEQPGDVKYAQAGRGEYGELISYGDLDGEGLPYLDLGGGVDIDYRRTENLGLDDEADCIRGSAVIDNGERNQILAGQLVDVKG